MTGKKEQDPPGPTKEIIEKSDVPPSGERIPMPNVKPPAESGKERGPPPKKEGE